MAERDRFRSLMESAGAPRRRPDPLDMPSFALPEERELPVGEPGIVAEPAPGAAMPGPLEVVSVTIDRRKDGSSIALVVGGQPTKVTHYAMTHPGRIVVDVFGDSRKRAKVEFMKVIDPLVRRVRVAHHDGRMRLVIDLNTDDPPAYELESRGGTLTFSLGAARPEAAEAHED